MKKILFLSALFLGALSLWTGIAIAQESWPMQGHDAYRTSRSSAPGPTAPALNWSYDFVGSRLQDNASPVIGLDGIIYQPTAGLFYAINPDGTLKWNVNVLSAFGMKNAPALSPDGKVAYVINSSNSNLQNEVIAFDLKNVTNNVGVAAGYEYSLALRQDGTVWAWGKNSDGQLGNGNNTSSNIPVQVSSLANIIAIFAGDGHSLTLRDCSNRMEF